MLLCPMCKKKLRGVETECGNCRTDVSLLVSYVQNLREGLQQAEEHTKAGDLGEAVWAYLAVLEVDPDNTTARHQVGKVATAVRQFDQNAPGRRWLKKLQKETRFRRWMMHLQEGEGLSWLSWAGWFLLFFSVLSVGYAVGYTTAPSIPRMEPADGETRKEEKPKPKEPRPGVGKEPGLLGG